MGSKYCNRFSLHYAGCILFDRLYSTCPYWIACPVLHLKRPEALLVGIETSAIVDTSKSSVIEVVGQEIQ